MRSGPSLRADSTVSAEERKGEESSLYRELPSPFRSSALTLESARRLSGPGLTVTTVMKQFSQSFEIPSLFHTSM